MKIQWHFADGTKSEVEVNEELGEFITASRREEDNLSRKERYHCYSLDAILFEGKEYGDNHTPPASHRQRLCSDYPQRPWRGYSALSAHARPHDRGQGFAGTTVLPLSEK